MPDISFPSNPSPNDTYTFGGKTWIWTGSYWALNSSGSINGIPIGNVTPSTGAFTTLSATGNITGDYFLGNGSQLTGIQAGAVTTVSSSPPGSPAQGDIWIDSDTGIQYIYFTASGNSQWAEMESETSISISSLDYGNANVLAYLTTGVAGNILPSANVTYDLGSTANRWNDIWLANSTIYLGEANISASGTAIVLPANTSVGGATIVASPLISAIDYPGDDTAADPAGGQTISIEGANFQSGAAVYVDGGLVGVVSFISSSVLQFVSPAKSAGSYSLYVVNPNGATAIAVPGIQYSGTPTWSTAAGNIGQAYETTAFATTVVATGDAPISYSVAAGNSLPTDMALTTANGYLSVATVPVTNNDTTYNFNIVATDAEQQDTPRQFSVTYKTDVVTWLSPANASSYTWAEGTANSVSMSATSAAGKAVSFAVQAGSLPSNVTIAGNLISGTPNVLQSNTSVTVRATAATTNRYADQTFYFTVVTGNPNRGLFAGGSWTTTNVIQYITITTTGDTIDFGDMTLGRFWLAACASTSRAIFAGGTGNDYAGLNVMDYVTIASTGDATDFGDLTQTKFGQTGCSSNTRGLFSGGGGSITNVIDYITIATAGNATDFGDLTLARYFASSCSSPTRGLIAGGYSSTYSNIIDYVTIASTGNATDFGDLLIGNSFLAGCSSSTRGLFGGGYASSSVSNTIQYVTIATTGNATDFGDLSVAREQLAACSSEIRGVFAGGLLADGNNRTNTVEYVTIASLGDSTDFGDLLTPTLNRYQNGLAGCSSNSGGVQ